MKFVYSDCFKKDVSALSQAEKKILKEKIILLFKNPKHPSLRVKKIQGRKDIFKASITMDIHMTCQYLKEYAILLRKVGPYDRTLKKPLTSCYR